MVLCSSSQAGGRFAKVYLIMITKCTVLKKYKVTEAKLIIPCK